MRTLSIALLVASTGLIACNGDDGGTDTGGTEICDNGLDDDGNGIVDDGCEDPEICGDGIDNDGDNLIDCDDLVDCPAADNPSCNAEDCENGVDDNENGLVDCDDVDDCGELIICNPVELWSIGGNGTYDGTSYTGTLVMLDEVFNNYNGVYNIEDVLCETHYTHTSSGPATNACTDCDFALTMNNPAPLDTTYGTGGYTQPAGTTYCTDWYDYSADWASVDWAAQWGFNSSYSYGGNAYPSAFSYSDGNGWGYGGLGTFDSGTGAVEWKAILGYYAY